jgi:hypothetical protein
MDYVTIVTQNGTLIKVTQRSYDLLTERGKQKFQVLDPPLQVPIPQDVKEYFHSKEAEIPKDVQENVIEEQKEKPESVPEPEPKPELWELPQEKPVIEIAPLKKNRVKSQAILGKKIAIPKEVEVAKPVKFAKPVRTIKSKKHDTTKPKNKEN